MYRVNRGVMASMASASNNVMKIFNRYQSIMVMASLTYVSIVMSINGNGNNKQCDNK